MIIKAVFRIAGMKISGGVVFDKVIILKADLKNDFL